MGGYTVEQARRRLRPAEARPRREIANELERHAPAVRGYVGFTELSTPLSTRHFANYLQGEIYGLSAVPARFR
jgi:all-trans-retinol 13,14-reductase